MANGDSIVYVYGAGGSKLQKLVYESSSLTASTHYAGAYVYKDDLVNYMQSAEGRISKTTSGFVYEYHLKDHIGNVRVAFIDDNGTPKVIQESDYYPFGFRFGEQRIGNDNKYLFSGKEQQDDVVAGVIGSSSGPSFADAYGYSALNIGSLGRSLGEYYNAKYYGNTAEIMAMHLWKDTPENGMGHWSPTNGAFYVDFDAEPCPNALNDNTLLASLYGGGPGDPSLFDKLWDNYPSSNIKHIDPKTGKDIFSDHCAINLSEALLKSGINLDGFKGVPCWGECPSGDHVHGIRAQELAQYLLSAVIDGVLEPVILDGKTYEDYVSGKNGIIYFEDYWQRNGETGDTRSGDHIDLWYENELASNGLFATWLRRVMPEIAEEYLDMSDLRKSKKVIFWEIKE